MKPQNLRRASELFERYQELTQARDMIRGGCSVDIVLLVGGRSVKLSRPSPKDQLKMNGRKAEAMMNLIAEISQVAQELADLGVDGFAELAKA